MKKRNFLIIITLLVLCIIVTLNMIINQNISMIILLPYTYLIGVVILSILDNNWSNSMVKLIIVAMYGVRMVLYPLVCFVENNIHELEINENFNRAIFLQIYEYMIIILTLNIFKVNNHEKRYDINIDKNNTKRIKNVVMLLLFVSVILIILYPQLINIFRPIIFSSTEDEIIWTRNKLLGKENMPMLAYYLGSWLIRLMRLVLMYFLIVSIKNSKIKKDHVKILLSLLVIASMLMITTDDKANGIYAAFTLFLLLSKLYSDKKDKIVKYGILSMCLITILVMVIHPLMQNKNTVQTDKINYSKKINAYFSSTVNIMAGLNMPTVDSVKYVKGDIFRYIPLVLAFFTDNPQSNDLFNQVLGVDVEYNSQIMPNVIQGYFYFGYILSPCFSIILACVAIISEKKSKICNDTFGYYIYIYSSILASMGIVLYYFSLTVYLFLQYIFPIWVMYRIFKRRSKQNEI